MTIALEESWLEYLEPEFKKVYMKDLKSFLLEEKKKHVVYPPGEEIFTAFNTTPFHQTKVVILGQDPYHGPDQAHGLSFSVRKGIRVPPSLKNIFKELETDLGIPISSHGDLTHWANQGVLLLNTVLTVRYKEANSHKNKGWEQFTDSVIQTLNSQKSALIFVLWGRKAQAKEAMIDESKHVILRSAHPSPFSAYNGFFGSRPFSNINKHLKSNEKEGIDWQLPA